MTLREGEVFDRLLRSGKVTVKILNIAGKKANVLHGYPYRIQIRLELRPQDVYQ